MQDASPFQPPATPELERRRGEAVLLGPGDRRPLPPGGLRVLLLGGDPSDLMLQGLVLGEVPGIARLETALDPASALRALAAAPAEHDLVVVSRRLQDSDAHAFGERLAGRVDASARPLLVLLAAEFDADDIARSERDGLFAARLLRPLCHGHVQALIGRLFAG